MSRTALRYGLAALLTATIALSACADSSGPAPEETTAAPQPGDDEVTEPGDDVTEPGDEVTEAGEFPLTFENADGTTTEIPAQPERIVSTAVTLTGSLLSFDAPVVASAAAGNGAYFDQWADVAEERGVETLWSAGSIDVESVIAQDPDLIVVASTGADSAVDNIADLERIAPTIVVDYGDGTWQEVTLRLAEATGQTDEAQAAIDEFATHIDGVASQITVPEGEANIISYNGPGDSNPIGRAGGPHAELLEQLGFTIEDPDPAWHTQDRERADFVWATYENLTELTAETTFILSQDNEGAQAFSDDAVLANLPSVQNDQVYGLGLNSFRIDYYSANEIVDGVLENFGS